MPAPAAAPFFLRNGFVIPDSAFILPFKQKLEEADSPVGLVKAIAEVHNRYPQKYLLASSCYNM
jgi:hypothetical protein